MEYSEEMAKYGKPKRTYNKLKKVYSNSISQAEIRRLKDNNTVIVEDSKAGYQFFNKVCRDNGINCITANGNGNILKTAEECGNNSLIVADGAAFGPPNGECIWVCYKKKM